MGGKRGAWSHKPNFVCKHCDLTTKCTKFQVCSSIFRLYAKSSTGPQCDVWREYIPM